MSVQTILMLIALSLALGLLASKWQRTNLLMVASIILLYWLQPETSLRYLGFWMPAFSISLIILAWMATTPAVIRKQPQTTRTIAIVITLIGLMGALKYLDPDQLLGFNRSPGFLSVLLFLSAIGFISFVWSRCQLKGEVWPWAVFAILLGLFIVLKTPQLTRKASEVWRFLAGQSPALASAAEFQWLGYSYIAFRLLHTVRDRQAGRLPEIALNEYLAYVVFFPSLLAGPIARVTQVLDDLKQPGKQLPDDIFRGSQRIVTGLFKKFVLADSLAVFALSSQNALQPIARSGSWILLYAYSLQIYLDFSGYTDIAIGLARLLSIQLPENFNHPYLKPNLTQFWNNWHMTLTNWFRAYFFNPLSRGLRKKKLPAVLILLVTQVSTMVLVGLWHGITPAFTIWGLWHGLGLLIQNRWSSWIKKYLPPSGQRPGLQKALDALGMIVTFHYVTLGWVWFVLPTPSAAWNFLQQLI